MPEDNDLGRLLCSFSNQDLHWSSLLLANYTIESATDSEFLCIVNSLFHLKFYKKIEELINKNSKLLKYKEIRLLFIKSGYETTETSNLSIEKGEFFEISHFSLELFFKAFSKQEMIRKKLFIDSFEADHMNIEALIFLFKESLCNIEELAVLINKIEHEGLRQIMSELITYKEVSDSFVCPLLLFASSSNVFFSKNCSEITSHFNAIFRSATINLEFFIDCELLYHSLGVYYLVKNRNREALKCFYKSIELNKHFGQGYLLAGIAHSRMRETETAVTVLNNSNYIIMASFIPSYCLACEYQIMNNIPVAKYHYQNSLKFFEKFNFNDQEQIHKKRRAENTLKDKTLNSYIYCLIYNEEYEEALRVLDENNINNVLRVFCYLFIGKLNEAKSALEFCLVDGRYFACKGFIMHIVEDFETAIHAYEKSLSIKRNKVVEKLMLMAQENFVNVKENKSYDYTNCLFESLGYNDPIF
jgi:anaphase-promoting complex subunit 6